MAARHACTSAAEVRGLGNVPEEGPVLLVGNHSGGNLTPDTDGLHARLQHLLRRRAAPSTSSPTTSCSRCPGCRSCASTGPSPPRTSNARKALAGRRRRARLPRRRLRGPPPELGGRPRRLRRAQGLHPARARRRTCRSCPVVSIGGQETALFLSRGERLAKAPAARQAVPPQGAADLDRAALGPQRRRHARPPAAAGQDHRRGAAADRPARASSAPTPTSTRSTTTSCALMQETLDALAAERRFPVLG